MDQMTQMMHTSHESTCARQSARVCAHARASRWVQMRMYMRAGMHHVKNGAAATWLEDYNH